MIRFQCDRCERELSFDDSQAGEKVECPYCGDVNRVPEAPVAMPAVAAPKEDRAAAAGLPPDAGPEQTVMLVRPAIWRSYPFRVTGLMLLPIATLLVMKLVFNAEWRPAGIGFAIGVALCWIPLATWWTISTMGVALRVTNKRVIERRGLLTRATSEVMHDHVRNIQIDQSFMNRVFRVGQVGISSSGQDGIEIEVRNIPSPDKLKDVIDKYRPM